MSKIYTTNKKCEISNNEVNCEYSNHSDIVIRCSKYVPFLHHSHSVWHHFGDTNGQKCQSLRSTVNQNVLSFIRLIITFKWSSIGNSTVTSLWLLLCDLGHRVTIKWRQICRSHVTVTCRFPCEVILSTVLRSFTR